MNRSRILQLSGIFTLLLGLFAPMALAQTITVKGVVKDAKYNEPVIGATVMLVENTSKGATTGMDGEFTLTGVPSNGTLRISYIGYKTVNLPINGQTNFNILLEDDVEVIDEVVITAFGTGQKKASVVGAVQTVRPTELKVPSANLSSSFAGRLAGVVSVQRSGAPGADGADFWIRGISTVNATSPLIILDGVSVSAGDLNALDPEVIEGFSILKDATATALYGSRGANGVVIVTTKSGASLEKPIINVRVEGYVNTPTKLPQFVDGPEYMEVFNEAIGNLSTGDVPYSKIKIDNTIAGIEPHIFPNVNWYNELFRNASFNQKANFNIRGGGQKVTYFMSVTADHQTGMLRSRSKEHSSFDNALQFYRYAFQNNLDINFTETSKISMKLNTQLNQSHGPDKNVDVLFGNIVNSNPVDFPIEFPRSEDYDYPLWGAIKKGPAMVVNPFVEAFSSYKDVFASTVIANLEFSQDLKMITEGLRFSALASFKNYSATTTTRYRGNNFFTLQNFEQNPETGGYDYDISRIGDPTDTTLRTGGGTGGDRRIYFHTMLMWDRDFGEHSLGAMFNYNQEETAINVGSNDLLQNLPKRKQGLAGRLTYSYANKYMLEANFGYNGSENFAAGKRFGFFPSIAAGYLISEEEYWEPLRPYVDYLKIRGSYGLVGNDAIAGGRFVYLSDITLGNGPEYTTGREQDTSYVGPNYNRFENPDISWEIGEKLNLGMDINFLGGFKFTGEYFREYRRNVFQERATVPEYMGTSGTKIYGNLGEISNEGFDLSLQYDKQFNKDFYLSLRSTFTYAHNKYEKWDESFPAEYPQLSRIGHSLNTHLLYIADRLFIDAADVANSADQKFTQKSEGGDIKYIDLLDANGNYSGTIDANDRMFMGYPTVPEIIYGFGVNTKYKLVDFGVFFQGVDNTSLVMSSFHPFGTQYNRNVLQWVADNRWRPDAPNIYAEYPRVTKVDHDGNTAWSTFWLRDGSFLKLKNVELGFTYKNARLYLSGTNLLTFSKFKLWDPEMGGGSGLKYPTQRTVNIGVQMSFN
ncbi:MAG: TonB-dependent receptor [Porphyromonas sp.]|nr:TonB-dependent receptor [Porphyromonas sp.]